MLESRISFFENEGLESDKRVTDISEKDIVDWLLRTPEVRELLLSELELRADTYVQTEVRDPIIETSRRQPPGDIDLIFVPQPDRAVAIQVSRKTMPSC